MSEKMIFCVGEGKYVSSGAGYQKNLQIFNQNVTEEVFNTTRSNISLKGWKLPIAKWIDIKEIKDPTSTQKQLGGMLKTLSYKDAWKEMYADMSKEDKQFIQRLPNFSKEIFEKITGIKIEKENDKKTELLKKADELIEQAKSLKEKAEEM